MVAYYNFEGELLPVPETLFCRDKWLILSDE